MPLYEYECNACGRRFERIQKFSDPPVETCPACGGAVRKLIASPAFQFKGTGWYITDYAKKDNGGPKTDGSDKESGNADKDASAKKDSTKTEPAPSSSSSESSPSATAPAAAKPSTKD